jgi:hypothetical protein
VLRNWDMPVITERLVQSYVNALREKRVTAV